MTLSFRFTEEDLALFADASGDKNPLHLSAAYASRTAYGERVVFGALGACACLGSLQIPEGMRITRITADFHRPMFLGVEYGIDAKAEDRSASIQLLDGTVPLVTVTVTYTPGLEAHLQTPQAYFEHSTAVERNLDDLKTGFAVSGEYCPDPSAFKAFLEKWRLTGVPFVAGALLWSSYLIGMELPGRDALFFRLALDFDAQQGAPDRFHYNVSISRVQVQIAQLRLAVKLNGASGSLIAFVRPRIEAAPPPRGAGSSALSGKVALVLGASRGLGAALVNTLAHEGAKVIAVARSESSLANSQIESEIGDAADPKWLAELRQRIAKEYGRLDFLICNAAPPIPSLRLEQNAQTRIESYLAKATRLVLAPFCAFLDLLDATGGCSVVVSSVAVEKPVRDWPHYVAGKGAVEGLARVAALQYPRTSTLIIRPERLLTEMTNTPMGRQSARSPEEAAEQIVRRLFAPPAAGTTEVVVCGSGAE